MQASRQMLGIMAVAFACMALSCASKDSGSTSRSAAATGGSGGWVDGAFSCGGAICAPLTAPGLMLPLEACCADPFTQTCGVRRGSSCLKRPPVHPTCGSVDLRDIGFVMLGCCTNQKCGLIDPFEPGGMCVDIETWKSQLAMTGEDLSLLPPAMACEAVAQ